MAEFNMWCPSKEVVGEGNDEVKPRPFEVFLMNENFKTTSARAKVIGKYNLIVKLNTWYIVCVLLLCSTHWHRPNS